MTAVDGTDLSLGLGVRSTSQLVGDAVRLFRAQVPECVASGLVDMSTGMLLAVDTVDEQQADEDLDLLAAATFDLFQGRNVSIIQNVFAERHSNAKPDRHYFQEMVANSDDLVHVFLRSVQHQDLVAVVVCRRVTNMGMLFAQARVVMKQMDSYFA